MPNLREEVAGRLPNLLNDPLLGPVKVTAMPGRTDIMVTFTRPVPQAMQPAIDSLVRMLSGHYEFETVTHTVRMEELDGLDPDEIMHRIQPPYPP